MDYQKVVAERNAVNKFPVSNGITLVEMSEGYARAVLVVTGNHTNPIGSVHGGCLFTLADVAAGAAAASYGEKITTADASYHYLRPALDLERIYAEACVIKRGRRLITVEVNVMSEKQDVLGRAIFTCIPL